MSTPTTRTFDYDQLDRPVQDTLRQHAKRIGELAQDAATDLWRMGEILADAQQQLASYGTGTFQAWLEDEAHVSRSTAYRLINVYRAFDCPKLGQTSFAVAALYVLAEPSAPPEAREEAMYRAGQGETITHAKAQEIVATYRPRPPPQPSPPPSQRPPEFEAFERDVLRPELHDAHKEDAPQMLSGRTAPLQPVPEACKERARQGLREAIVDGFMRVRQMAEQHMGVLLVQHDGLAILNDPTYKEMWASAACPEDQEQMDAVADELLLLLGKSTNSIAIASRFGVALAGGPKTLNDLTEIAIWTCDKCMDGMPRDEYLQWRKRSLRLLDAIGYLNGCPIYEHKLESGQLVYGLLSPENEATIVG